MATWAREMFEDLYEEKRDIEIQMESDDTSSRERERLQSRLRRLNRSLGEGDGGASADPLIDKWMAELDAGLVPDLNEKL